MGQSAAKEMLTFARLLVNDRNRKKARFVQSVGGERIAGFVVDAKMLRTPRGEHPRFAVRLTDLEGKLLGSEDGWSGSEEIRERPDWVSLS